MIPILKMRVSFIILCLINVYCLPAQNYLDDGGFENYKSSIGVTSPCSTTYTGSCGLDVNQTSYFSTCPGGYATVNEKMQYWTDRGNPSLIGTCDHDFGLCAPHSPDWIYTGQYGGDGGVSWTCANGSNGCIGAITYELFQQQMHKYITMGGNYIVSALIRTTASTPSKTWYSSSYDIQFILDQNQTTYDKESCNDDKNNPSGYITLHHDNLILPYTFYKSAPISDWTPIAIPFTLTTTPNFHWFSVNVAGADVENTGPYVGFDEVYISDEQCYCPVIRDIEGETYSGVARGWAQKYLILGTDNVVIPGSGSTNALFTAGNAITVNPGFNTELGVTAEIRIGSCFDGVPSADFYIPNPYDACPHDEEGDWKFCFYTKNITEYTFSLYDELGQAVVVNENGEINTSIVNASGYNVTCFDLPIVIDGQYVDYSFTGTGCNADISSNDKILLMGPCSGKKDNHNVSNKQKIAIYPDPFCNSIIISCPEYSNGDQVSVMDINGRVVRSIRISELTTSIEMSGLQNGPYLVNYTGLNVSTTQKVNKACD